VVATMRRCQWCGEQLSDEQAVCPGCGAVVAGPLLDDEAGETAVVAADAPDPAPEAAALIEWWRDDNPEVEAVRAQRQLTFEEAERRSLLSIAVIVCAAALCLLLGLASAPLLAPLIESLTGSPVQDTSDLRPLGGLLGLLGGLLVGAIGGWIIWSNR
jgi:hypothetical protein